MFHFLSFFHSTIIICIRNSPLESIFSVWNPVWLTSKPPFVPYEKSGWNRKGNERRKIFKKASSPDGKGTGDNFCLWTYKTGFRPGRNFRWNFVYFFLPCNLCVFLIIFMRAHYCVIVVSPFCRFEIIKFFFVGNKLV